MERRESRRSNHSKNEKPAAAVASTGCFRCCFSLRRPTASPSHRSILNPSSSSSSSNPAKPRPAPLSSLFRDGEAAAHAYWHRAKQLEQEIQNLNQRLAVEFRLAESLKNSAVREEDHHQMLRLQDGSYLRKIKKLGRPWGSLVMQVSTPMVAENAVTVEEVLSGMASCKREEVCKYLEESMPLQDVSPHRSGEIRGKKVAEGSEDDFMEALLLSAIDKMESLAVEGLRIQMGTGGGGNEVAEEENPEKAAMANEDRVVLVVLIQIRDPKESYEAVGELMIGLIESDAGEAAAGKKLELQGIHIAGMKCTTAAVADGRDYIWSTSIKGCKGLHKSCCLHLVRNPNRFFAR
ncbi:hypothetical protein ZIOFF_049714 [Zingiber officinale]|uniref:Uncharacterized protein n=2 Tax=Zingiber officinale TaxID=94328 RepID=A0A8J5FQ35_ZINOF|nr:hypothetical protein ZIOFF_049714 [Zingiber officinale]